MRKTWTLRFVAIVLATLLAVPATIAAPQQQSGTQPQEQTSGQPAQQPPAQGGQPAKQDGGQQTSGQPIGQDGQQPPAAAPASQNGAQPPQAQGEQPIPQSTDPKIKQGGKQDVDAIGNRSVGHGLNFYSLEHEIALGKIY